MAHLIPADENTRVGITNSGGGIGDKLQFTSIPENYSGSSTLLNIDTASLASDDSPPFDTL